MRTNEKSGDILHFLFDLFMGFVDQQKNIEYGQLSSITMERLWPFLHFYFLKILLTLESVSSAHFCTSQNVSVSA